MELWQLALGIGSILLGFGGMMIPVVLAAFNRERALHELISSMKDEVIAMLEAHTDPLHDRINRVRDEFVRRDDLEGHLGRIDRRFDATDKRFDEFREELRRGNENLGKALDDIKSAISSRTS